MNKEEIESYLFPMIEEMVRCKILPIWATERETVFRIYESMTEINHFGDVKNEISSERLKAIIESSIETISSFYEKRKKIFGSIPEEWLDINKITSKDYIDSFIADCRRNK